MTEVIRSGSLNNIEIGTGDWGLGIGDWENLDGNSDPNEILKEFPVQSRSDLGVSATSLQGAAPTTQLNTSQSNADAYGISPVPSTQSRNAEDSSTLAQQCGELWTQPVESIAFDKRCLEEARETGDADGGQSQPNEEVISLGNLGNAYQSLGEYHLAIEFYQQWLDTAREIGDRLGEAKALSGLGNAYQSLGKYQRAIEFYQQWLSITRKIGDRTGEGICLGSLGNTYEYLGKYKQAIEFYQQWLSITKNIGDWTGECLSLGSLGNTYESLGNYQLAIEFYQQWLGVARFISDRNGEGMALSGLGSAYKALGQYQMAFEFHQHSLEIRRNLDDRNGEANAWFNLGLVLEKINRESEAIDAFCNAREIYHTMGLDASLQDCNHAIELLSQNVATFTSGFWFGKWLNNLSQLIKSGSNRYL
ncbi:tetratricopeptide repeat protein [Nostoc sp.]|uniref:tetratricopeptide repeat protein n=1 Tax=Nostoc sp. TaxID=1180 RepID=UPI002FF6776F